MDFLFFIISFIMGVGLFREASTSSSPSSSSRTARLSACSLSGPRQVVTDCDTSDTELRSDFLLLLPGVLAGVFTSSVLEMTAMDLRVCFFTLPLTAGVPLVALSAPSDFLATLLVDPASAGAGADLFLPEPT